VFLGGDEQRSLGELSKITSQLAERVTGTGGKIANWGKMVAIRIFYNSSFFAAAQDSSTLWSCASF